MELKQRKKIKNNLPKFYPGSDSGYGYGSVNYNFKLRPWNYYMTHNNDEWGYNYAPSDQNYAYGNGLGSTQTDNKNASNTANMASGVANLVQSGIQFGAAADEAYSSVKSSDEMVGESGRRQGSVMGIGYDKVDEVDRNLQMSDLRRSIHKNNALMGSSGTALGAAAGGLVAGAAYGSSAGPYGIAIGAILGAGIGLGTGLHAGRKRRAKLRKRIAEANQRINNYNAYSRESAMSKGLEQDYYMRYGDSSDDLLYANRGKDLKRPKKY